MEVPTMRIRFRPEEGGHEGLINASDFDPARHLPIEKALEPEAPTPGEEPEAPASESEAPKPGKKGRKG